MRVEYTPQQRAEALDDFELFIFNLSDVTETFVEQAEEAGYDLDYSLNSLDELEEYALEVDAKPLSDFHGHASQYLGQILLKGFGYHWELSLDMKDNSLHYGKPVLVGPLNNGVQFAPYSIMRNFLTRQLKGMLKRAVLSHVDFKPLDLSHIPDDET